MVGLASRTSLRLPRRRVPSQQNSLLQLVQHEPALVTEVDAATPSQKPFNLFLRQLRCVLHAYLHWP